MATTRRHLIRARSSRLPRRGAHHPRRRPARQSRLLEAASSLRADDFALDSHQRVFARMGELIDRNHAVDIVTLGEELARRKEIESVGGVACLASLTEGLPRRLSIEEYVRIVKDKSLLRQLINICSSAITRAADQSEDALEVLNAAEPRCSKSRRRASPAASPAFTTSSRILLRRSTTFIRKAARSPASPRT